MTKKLNTVILGASGYTGIDLYRLLQGHPEVEVKYLVGESSCGRDLQELYPSTISWETNGLKCVKFEEVDFTNIDIVFSCLPHGVGQKLISTLPENIQIIDLSADYRLKDLSQFEKYYGSAHTAPELQAKAVYGLTEIYKDKIKDAKIIACPGCYPTSMLLPLIPIKDKLTDATIIIDAKSGMTGAGRSLRVGNLFVEMNDNIKPYALSGRHRHNSELAQELEGRSFSFNPQIIPTSRGILSNIYVESKVSIAELKETLADFYKDSPFIIIPEDDHLPCVRDVAGSNYAVINVFTDELNPNRAVIVSTIDNLIKGSAGQAVQNMNIRYGFEETTGLKDLPKFP